MQTPSLDQSPILIVQSRLGLGLLFAADVALVVLLVWLLSSGALSGASTGSAGFITGIFGLIGLALGVVLLRPAKLEIARDGVTYHGLFGSLRRPWSDFSGFNLLLVREGRATSFRIAYTLDPALLRPSLPGRPQGAPDGTWTGAWTLKAQAVVDLLNAGLERWGPRRPG